MALAVLATNEYPHRAGTMGCTKPSTVAIRGTEYLMKDVLDFGTLTSVGID